MHQNPDWIVVQEIRHPAEAETALAAALPGGHLVLALDSCLHGRPTPQRYLSIINPTLEDVGARDALASCLEGVLLQRLVEGYEGLVPVFEIMLMRNLERRMERINAMENNLRLGNWVACGRTLRRASAGNVSMAGQPAGAHRRRTNPAQ